MKLKLELSFQRKLLTVQVRYRNLNIFVHENNLELPDSMASVVSVFTVPLPPQQPEPSNEILVISRLVSILLS